MNIKQATTDAYDKIATEYSESHFHHFWIDEFDFYKSIIDGKRVVDIGCGAGRDAIVFVENGFDYTGIDASKGMLGVAKKLVPKGKFKQADFCKTDFPNGAFDGFWAAGSFLHIPKKDVSTALLEAKRITKNGGCGFVAVREKTGSEEGMIYQEKHGGINRYFAFYTQEEFKTLLEKHGFSIIKMGTHMENDERKTNWLYYFARTGSHNNILP